MAKKDKFSLKGQKVSKISAIHQGGV